MGIPWGAPNEPEHLYGGWSTMSLSGLETGPRFDLAVRDALMLAASVLAGRGIVRVGLEDTLWLGKASSPRNEALVSRAVCRSFENMGATSWAPMPCRQKLGLTKAGTTMTQNRQAIHRRWKFHLAAVGRAVCIVLDGTSRFFGTLDPEAERKISEVMRERAGRFLAGPYPRSRWPPEGQVKKSSQQLRSRCRLQDWNFKKAPRNALEMEAQDLQRYPDKHCHKDAA